MPGLPRLLGRCSGHTRSALYCYGVWMRHLSYVLEHGSTAVPRVVAELGPGPSLGTLLAALLSGAHRGYAFDVTAHADSASRNKRVLDELCSLFQEQAPIPDEKVLPGVLPMLADYRCPPVVATPTAVPPPWSARRVESVRAALRGENGMVRYVAPWHEHRVMEPQTVDLIFSQAVLEHVADLPGVLRVCHTWLRPGGLMSHQIDLSCHGTARHWNGHLTYSDPMWRFLSSARPYLINREPYSVYHRLLRETGFELVHERVQRRPSQLARSDLAPRFRDLDDTDLTTSGVYLLARRVD